MRHRLGLSSAEGRATAKGAELLVKWSPTTGCQYQVGAVALVSTERRKNLKISLFFALKNQFFFQCMLMMWEHVPNCMTEWYMYMWHHQSVRLLRWSTTLAR